MDGPALNDVAFRGIVESSPDGVLLVDGRGLITFANEQAERLFDCSREEMLGKRVETLVPERLRPTHLIHREVYQEHPESRAMGPALELIARRADGEEFPVEVGLSPLRLSDGSMVTVAVVRDVTRRKRADAALRRSEERHRLIAEHAKDVIYRYCLRPEPAFEYVSSASTQLLGHTPEDFYADRDLVLHLVHPDDRDILERGLSEDAPETYVVRMNRRDGELRWFEQLVTRVLDDGGHVVAIEGVARDITDRRRAEEERGQLLSEIETQLERERIAGDLHDDIIQSIYAVGLGLHADRTDDGVGKEPALERAVEGLNSVIGALRTYMQQLNGDFEDRTGTEPLTSRLRSLVADAQDVEWRIDVPADLALHPTVDRHLFLLAKELVSNVNRHAEARRASIGLRDDADGLELTIADDGVGFDRADVPDSSFGLRSVDHRVGMLGGTIDIESVRGVGTRMTVRVPLEALEGADLERAAVD